jgi:hypothetical protein
LWEEEGMKFRRSGRAVPIGLLVGLLAMSADAADILTLHATSGQFLLAGFYPAYVVFLKGLDPAATKTEWVDKPYKAVLDIREGPEKGQSVAVELVPTTAASPNPQWCSTEGGEKFTGGGLTCVPGSAAKDQLRFRVRALYADGLPTAFSGRKVAEYPNLPGRRENEVLGSFDMHILVQE